MTPTAPRALFAAALVGLAPRLAGCREEVQDPDTCLPGDAPTLEVGKGELEFHPMDEDGARLELIHGPQGGFHVLIALRAQRIDASGIALGEVEGWLDGEVRARSEPYLDFRCNGESQALETWGTLLIWDALPEELDGREVTIDARVTDASGTVVEASATATIEDPTL